MNPFRRKNDQVATSVVLDTSGLIDGRIVEIAKAGFVPQNVVVPQFVIAELQFLADHGDSHKRERARYGLDVIRELQDVRRIEVSISREKFPSIKEVDDKLVALARQYGAYLYTTDFNLNKVAQIEGVAVLNVNELAHALRPNLLPGEVVSIKLTQVGQDKTQGVGYLGDGTMVVVEQASRYIGQQIQAVCTRILQTQAGKMMFATLANKAQLEQQAKPLRDQPPVQKPQQQAPKPHTPQPSQQKQQPKPRHHDQRNRGNGGVQHPQGSQQKSMQKPQQAAKPKAAAKSNAADTPSAKPQQGSKQHPSSGGRNQKRRFSPEDSLIATLKEIEK